MIDLVLFRCFKAYRSLDLELEPLTVLVGPNASGKTTILQGLDLLARCVHERPSEVLAGEAHPSKLCTRGNVGSGLELAAAAYVDESRPRVIFLHQERSSVSARLAARPISTEPGGWVYEASVSWNDQPMQYGDGPIANPALAEMLSPAVFLRLDPDRLAAPAYSEQEVPSLDAHGHGLAALLAYLKLEHEERFAELERGLREVVPSVERIRLTRVPVQEKTFTAIEVGGEKVAMPQTRIQWGHEILFDMKGAASIPAAAAGEGTLLALGLLAVLHQPQPPRLLLLDDIEIALHPAAQERLVKLIEHYQKRSPPFQVVATSHSPFILNWLKPEQVRLTAIASDGAAYCRKLTEHPEFARWKDVMKPGEFWSTVGEKWLLEGHSS